MQTPDAEEFWCKLRVDLKIRRCKHISAWLVVLVVLLVLLVDSPFARWLIEK